MKCHYTYDKEAGKVWIPGCWGGIYGPDGCTCAAQITTLAQYEKKGYNEEIAKKNAEIKELSSEVFRLERVVKNLLNRTQNPEECDATDVK